MQLLKYSTVNSHPAPIHVVKIKLKSKVPKVIKTINHFYLNSLLTIESHTLKRSQQLNSVFASTAVFLDSYSYPLEQINIFKFVKNIWFCLFAMRDWQSSISEFSYDSINIGIHIIYLPKHTNYLKKMIVETLVVAIMWIAVWFLSNYLKNHCEVTSEEETIVFHPRLSKALSRKSTNEIHHWTNF